MNKRHTKYYRYDWSLYRNMFLHFILKELKDRFNQSRCIFPFRIESLFDTAFNSEFPKIKYVWNHIKDWFCEQGTYKISVFRWEKNQISKNIRAPWKEGSVRLKVDKTYRFFWQRFAIFIFIILYRAWRKLSTTFYCPLVKKLLLFLVSTF